MVGLAKGAHLVWLPIPPTNTILPGQTSRLKQEAFLRKRSRLGYGALLPVPTHHVPHLIAEHRDQLSNRDLQSLSGPSNFERSSSSFKLSRSPSLRLSFTAAQTEHESDLPNDSFASLEGSFDHPYNVLLAPCVQALGGGSNKDSAMPLLTLPLEGVSGVRGRGGAPEAWP